MAVDIWNHNLPVERFSPLSRGQRLREQTAGVGRLFFGGYTAVSLSLSKKWGCYVWKTICQFTMDVSYFFTKTWDGTVKNVPYIVVCGF